MTELIFFKLDITIAITELITTLGLLPCRCVKLVLAESDFCQMTQDASVEGLLKQGHEQLDREQNEAALEIFQQATQLEAQNPQVWFWSVVATLGFGALAWLWTKRK